MRKFFEILLKIIIVVSFVCIIVFVGVAIFNNRSIAYLSYNYIVSLRDSTKFSSVQNGISKNLLKEFQSLEMDPIGEYINNAGIELNKGIDFYLDYLSQEDNLTKGEQDTLINGYKKYAESFTEVYNSYYSYLDAYKVALDRYNGNYEDSHYAIATANAKGLYIISSYIESYKLGSAFFKDLVNISNRHTLKNISYQTHKGQSYQIKVGLVDYSLYQTINENGKIVIGIVDMLNERLSIEGYSGYNVDNNPNAKAFKTYLKTCNNVTDKDYLVDDAFRAYTQNLNDMNIFEWAGNYLNYCETLKDAQKQKAFNTKAYFNNTYAI